MKVDVVKYKFGTPDMLLKILKTNNTPYLIKKTSESSEIIFSNTKFIFVHSNKFPSSKLFLFKAVNRDVTKWLENKGQIILPPKHDVAKFNTSYDDSYGEITATDINHAYWRIAYVRGIISEKTYLAGLDNTAKALRLATISVLGRKKSYAMYENGKKSESVTLDEGDEKKRMIYKYIRYFCYQMMYELSIKLGDDFDCWKTDCIYYRNTPENIDLVHSYFDEKEMEYKQLVF
jgi:hypothetical protein